MSFGTRAGLTIMIAAWAALLPLADSLALGPTYFLGDGTGLDASFRIGDGGFNGPIRRHNFQLQNNIVTGNVAGLAYFRCEVGYRAPGEFHDRTSSDDLFRFQARSYPTGLPLGTDDVAAINPTMSFYSAFSTPTPGGIVEGSMPGGAEPIGAPGFDASRGGGVGRALESPLNGLDQTLNHTRGSCGDDLLLADDPGYFEEEGNPYRLDYTQPTDGLNRIETQMITSQPAQRAVQFQHSPIDMGQNPESQSQSQDFQIYWNRVDPSVPVRSLRSKPRTIADDEETRVDDNEPGKVQSPSIQ